MRRRAERVAALLEETVAALLVREVKDPRLAGVTVTRARVSADLAVARVSFTVLGGEHERARAEAGLRSARRFLRARVARKLGLRRAPELRFEFDSSGERARRVEALLREVGAGQLEAASGEGEEAEE